MEMSEFTIRNATPGDLDAIARVEEDWPEEQRAGIDKFVSRLERFPEGFFVAEVDGQVAAVSTATLTHYDASDLSAFQSWEKCTNDGYFFPVVDSNVYNAVLIVSNGIMKQHRRRGIREGMINAHLELAARLGMEYAVTGAMIPGYKAYCLENGDIPAEEYAFMKKDGELIDPTLRKLASLGLILPDKRHIVRDYYPSPESGDYGALLVCKTPESSRG